VQDEGWHCFDADEFTLGRKMLRVSSVNGAFGQFVATNKFALVVKSSGVASK
jgi:hypothetical protein